MRQRIRFIPACAGNTPIALSLTVLHTVHPRVCGEHILRYASNNRRVGSSPRVRGTLLVEGKNRWLIRFIPACAGNTAGPGCGNTGPTVHPRVCGEHAVSLSAPATTVGSSPRVRGTHRAQRGCRWGLRFIPACAGNTELIAGLPARLAVHPRVCGEHCGHGQPQCQADGSSPRVRGTPQRICQQPLLRRFIPACAGNTALAISTQLVATVHPRVCGEHVGR